MGLADHVLLSCHPLDDDEATVCEDDGCIDVIYGEAAHVIDIPDNDTTTRSYCEDHCPLH